MKPRHAGYPAQCVVAYLRVSTNEQAVSGLGLAAQRAAIEDYATRNGLTVARWFADEGVSGTVEPDKRPQLSAALDVLAACKSGALLISRLDRLSRSVRDLMVMLGQAEKAGWTLSAADGSVDMSTPNGRALVGMNAVFSQLERDLIAQRTEAAMEVLKAQGRRLGRPTALPNEVRQRIATERQSGRTLTAIAKDLTAENVPTAQGGKRWYPSTVKAVMDSLALDLEAVELGQQRQGRQAMTNDPRPETADEGRVPALV